MVDKFFNLKGEELDYFVSNSTNFHYFGIDKKTAKEAVETLAKIALMKDHEKETKKLLKIKMPEKQKEFMMFIYGIIIGVKTTVESTFNTELLEIGGVSGKPMKELKEEKKIEKQRETSYIG